MDNNLFDPAGGPNEGATGANNPRINSKVEVEAMQPGDQETGVKIGMIQAGTVIVQSQVRNQPPAAESPTRKNVPKPPPLSLGERNHLLISLDTPFNHAIWEELLHNKETLNIGSVPDFKKDNSFGQYKRYMMPSLAVTRFTNRLPASGSSRSRVDRFH